MAFAVYMQWQIVLALCFYVTRVVQTIAWKRLQKSRREDNIFVFLGGFVRRLHREAGTGLDGIHPPYLVGMVLYRSIADDLKMDMNYRHLVKKIEAVILHKYEKEVVDALRALELGGFTVLNGKGRGRGPRRIKEGLGRYIEPFNEVDMIYVVVDDSKVKSVVSAIANAAHTGSLGDGKIFISPIEDVLDVTTLKKGKKYL